MLYAQQAVQQQAALISDVYHNVRMDHTKHHKSQRHATDASRDCRANTKRQQRQSATQASTVKKEGSRSFYKK